MVQTRLQFHRRQTDLRLCLDTLPFPFIKLIFHLRIDILSCSMTQMERHRGFLLQQHLFLEVHTQGGLSVTERQRVLSRMRLTGTICDIGFHDEVIEHRIIGLRQRQRHIHLEATVSIRDGLTLRDLHILRARTDITAVPISPVGDPPVGPASYHTILHLRFLDRHPCIALGNSLHRHGVTLFIIFLIRIELHFEGGPFVFLHPEVMSLIVGNDAELSCQS